MNGGVWGWKSIGSGRGAKGTFGRETATTAASETLARLAARARRYEIHSRVIELGYDGLSSRARRGAELTRRG